MADEPNTVHATLADYLKATPGAQEDLDKIISTRLERDRKLRGSADEKAAALEIENKQLWEKLSDHEKTIATLKQVETERDAAIKERDRWKLDHSRHLAAEDLRRLAEQEKVVPGALDFIVKAVLTDAEIEIGKDGKPITKLNGKPLDADAFKAMLADRTDILAVNPGGGAGSGGVVNRSANPVGSFSFEAARAAVNDGTYQKSSPEQKAAIMSALEGAVKGK